MNRCCKPYLYGWWQRRDFRPAIFQRHQDRTCVGQMEEIDFNVWYTTGERKVIR